MAKDESVDMVTESGMDDDLSHVHSSDGNLKSFSSKKRIHKASAQHLRP